MMFDKVFSDLTEEINKAFTYTPLTEERIQISYVNDISEWAEGVACEWHPGLFRPEDNRAEDRAHCAQEIMDKCNELKELIAEMENL
jgi:hypothetical protein